MARRILISLAVFLALSVPAAGAFARAIPINIESVPPGATIYLDSTATPLGQAPLRNVRVERGNHTLIFRLANHEEARLQVNVRRRRETFRAVLRALGTIEISAGNASAQGAQVFVDGRNVGGSLGPTPLRVTDLQPGRHQVRVSREGYEAFEQWVEVGGGQLVRIAAMLERSAPDTGSILVSGPSGAPVFMDGQARGMTPTVIEGVAVGPHTIEIRPPGVPPHSQTVTVLAGQRATVAMPSATGGTLRVIANAPNAVISIDGEVVGPSPATQANVVAGEHIVEATAEGYERARQTVTVTSGQQRVVMLEMQAVRGEVGRIIVQANVDGATVFIDNEDRGSAPVVYTPEPGPHAIVVRADGHQEYSTTCETGPGRNCEVQATLVPQQVRVRVAVQPGIQGAELYIDDNPVGPIPFDGTLPAGSHLMSVRAPGYEESRAQVLLQPSSEVRPFDITLPRITDGLSADERTELAQEEERLRGAAVTHSAAPLPVNQALIDLSLGWPYLGELRLSVGIVDFLDAGFSIRSVGRLTEFEGRVRVGYRPLQQLSVGAQVRFGGGIGPESTFGEPIAYRSECPTAMCSDLPWDTADHALSARSSTRPTQVSNTTNTFSYPINSAFLSIEGMGSLHFSDQGAFTLWVALDFSSDEYAGHGANSGAYLDYGPDAVDMADRYCDPTSGTLECPREDYARVRLGGSLDLVLSRNWNLWFLLEGILSSQPRRVLGNIIGIEANDTQFYFRIGTTYKF